MVSNICVHASQDAKQPIAIIIPHEVHLRHFLVDKNLSGITHNTHLPELCNDKRVQELVMKECNALGKKNGFKTMELLEAVILDPEEWTPENGMTTAAQKIQRKKIAGHFRKEIDVRRLSFSAHILFMKCADFLSFPGNLQESVSSWAVPPRSFLRLATIYLTSFISSPLL